MKKIKFSLATILLSTFYYPQYAVASSIDQQREDIIRYSRLGEEQLRDGTKQLAQLYQRTADRKVRDDLITLLVRQNQYNDALSLCTECKLNQYSVNELEHLGKAARNARQLEMALAFYAQLNKVQPRNTNGLLGLALVSTEISDFNAAKQYLAKYKRRFGADKQYTEANTYFLDHSEPLTARLARLQNELERNPADIESAKKLYRVAAQLNISPLQEKLISAYPDLFNENDKLWLLHDDAVRLYRVITNRTQAETAYRMLNEANNQTSAAKNKVLKVQILRDMIVVSSKLRNGSDVENAYSQLQELDQDIPAFVKEAYADHLLLSGSPFSALEMYREVEDNYLKQKQKVPFSLGMKLVSAMSDTAKFAQAQEYLEQHISAPSPYVLDFTRERKVKNPNFDEYFLGKVNLAAWRGDLSRALELIDERLEKTPGDAWMMLRKAELENSRMRTDEALKWVDKATAILGNDSRWAEVTKANIALSTNDWKTASAIVNDLSEEEKIAAKYVIDQYEQGKAARFVASGSVAHRTFPAGKPNENKQEYYLHSAKTDNGHNVYVHYLATKSPDEYHNFEQYRIGAGAEMNFYPVTMSAEIGKGLKLNEKYYLLLDALYRLSQHWQFNLYGNINGSDTPVKALYQHIYTKDLGLAVTYVYSNLFKLFANINAMKFDDGNLRKNMSLASAFNLFKYDRWSLDGNLLWTHQRNKRIARAFYYNPFKSHSAEGNLNLSYLQPLNHQITLVHYLKGSVGRYWQDHYASNNTWSVSYGHEWRLGKKLSLSYELGRNKSVYDGAPEFNNFINTNLAVYFW